MPKIDKYCLGFLFDDMDRFVVMIEKKRPEWAAGKWNGLGGKVLRDENYAQAMEREFMEECGVNVPATHWREFATMTGGGWEVHIFEARAHISVLHLAISATDERVAIQRVDEITSLDKSLRHLPCPLRSVEWLIPLALDRTKHYSHIQSQRPS